MAISQTDLQTVLDAIKASSTDVAGLALADSLNGLTSLPAMRGQEMVLAPLSLLDSDSCPLPFAGVLPAGAQLNPFGPGSIFFSEASACFVLNPAAAGDVLPGGYNSADGTTANAGRVFLCDGRLYRFDAGSRRLLAMADEAAVAAAAAEGLRAQYLAGLAADGIRRNLLEDTNDGGRNWAVAPADYEIFASPMDGDAGDGLHVLRDWAVTPPYEAFLFNFDAGRIRPGRYYRLSFDVAYTPHSDQSASAVLEIGLVVPATPSVGVSRHPDTTHTRRQATIARERWNIDNRGLDDDAPTDHIDLLFLGQRITDSRYSAADVRLSITTVGETLGDWNAIRIANLKLEELPARDAAGSAWCKAPEDIYPL